MKRLTEMTVDEYNADIIANAVFFTATKRAGVGKYDTRRAETQPAVMEIAHTMGRGTIIYAFNASGRRAFVDTIR